MPDAEAGYEGRTVQLLAAGTAQAKLQEIKMVMDTPKGSVPMYREFGFDWGVLDKPAPVAQLLCRATIPEAIERWVPGVRVVGISFGLDEKTGTLIPVVEVEDVESA